MGRSTADGRSGARARSDRGGAGGEGPRLGATSGEGGPRRRGAPREEGGLRRQCTGKKGAARCMPPRCRMGEEGGHAAVLPHWGGRGRAVTLGCAAAAAQGRKGPRCRRVGGRGLDAPQVGREEGARWGE